MLSGCSWSFDYVVVNDSDKPIDTRYGIKKTPNSFAPPEMPSTLTSSELVENENLHWVRLGHNRYRVDWKNRIVEVQIMPHEALLVVAAYSPNMDAKDFPLEYIEVRGQNGTLTFTGEQALRCFSEDSTRFRVLRYN